jgi:hypothetical protein
LRFCPASPPIIVIVVIVIVNVVIVAVIVVYGAITVAVALALTVDFNIATVAGIDTKCNWGAVVILLLLATRRWPSGQLSGQLAPTVNAIAATANGRIIRASY